VANIGKVFAKINAGREFCDISWTPKTNFVCFKVGLNLSFRAVQNRPELNGLSALFPRSILIGLLFTRHAELVSGPIFTPWARPIF
jgi:hypothetical protein